MNRFRVVGLTALLATPILASALLATGAQGRDAGRRTRCRRDQLSAPHGHRSGRRTAVNVFAACTALLGAHQVPANDYRKLHSQFASSRWPDFRTMGMPYVAW